MPDREEAYRALDRLSDEELHEIVHRIAQDPRVLRSTGIKGWWRRYAGSIAFLSLIALAALGFWQQGRTLDRIEQERTDRTESVTGIIEEFCGTNNKQDRTLARLVEVSLGGGGFGEEVDPDSLTPFDLRVLTTISTVQAMTKDSQLERVFERELKDLQDDTSCRALVKNFVAGEPIPEAP